ncbi:MAG TPA: SIMPL domain-containing protein [Feifaniaceae bacterium]|nr:SIMPL domain-containing protein [Feifaniaceae bacterium]
MKKAIACALICILIAAAVSCKTPEEINQTVQQPNKDPQQIIIQQPAQPDERLLSVTGKGKVDAQPDVSTIQLSVYVQAATAEEAQTQNSVLMDAVITAIKGLGVAEKDMKTQEITVYPIMDNPKNTQEITGYSATNSITVKLRDVKKTGELVTLATQAGANEVTGISFELLDETSAYRQALADAVADANAKAAIMAEAAGAQLDGPMTIQEVGYTADMDEQLQYAAMPAKADTDVATPVQAGQLTVSAEVAVQFKLKWPAATPAPTATPKP